MEVITPFLRFGPFTTLVGGLYHGERRPICLLDPQGRKVFGEGRLVLPSIEGAAPVRQGDCVSSGAVQFDQFYHLHCYQIIWPSGIVWQYTFWLAECLVPLGENIVSVVPHWDCHLEVYRLPAHVKQPPSPMVRLDYGEPVSLN